MNLNETKNYICAIIVVYNGFDCLRKTVETIINQVGKVVLIDNNSDEDTLNLIKDLVVEYNSIDVIYNGKNLGIAAAFNQGVDYIKKNGFKFVLTLDQDSTSAHNMVDEMLKVYEEKGNNPMISLCPQVVYDCVDSPVVNADAMMNWRSRLVTISSGHLFNISLFDSVGNYNEELFIDSVDFDYCLRIQLAGGEIIECTNAILSHTLGQPIKVKVLILKYNHFLHSGVRLYYITRNHIYIKRQYIFKFPFFCIKKTISYCFYTIHDLLFQPNKIANIKYVIKGVRDGHSGKMGVYGK